MTTPNPAIPLFGPSEQVDDDDFFERKYNLYNDLPECIRDALADPDTQDVMVNPGGGIFIHRHGRQFRIGDMEFPAMMRFCRKAGKLYGRPFDVRNPTLSAILPGNERLEAVYQNVSVDGLTFVLRRPGPVWTLDELYAKGSISRDQLAALRETATDLNTVVSGWIGAGKSTLVRAILAEPSVATMRRVSIETDPEVQQPENGSRLVASTDADFDALFKSTLRMNTQLIVLSEVRTPAHVWALVEAATTGHIGKTTIHARNPLAAATRMHRIVQRVSPVPVEDIAMACELVVHVAPTGDGNRKVTEIAKISTDGERLESKQLA